MKKQFGILSTRTVELPYATKEDSDRAAELNRQLASLGARTYRAATDWGYARYADLNAPVLATGALKKHLPRVEPVQFQQGDLVKIFSTVTDGDVMWQDKIKFKTMPKTIQQYQAGADRALWYTMFNESMPAKLEQGKKIMYGALDAFYEQGMEGISWCLREYGYDSYGALRPLKNGDRLTVYKNVRDGALEWEGRMDFGPEQVKKLGWIEILREANHMDNKKWMSLCYQNRPVMVTPAAP